MFRADNLIFTGWIDENKIWALMGLAVAGLATYTRDALQSLPNKPFEYWAAGLPILSSLAGELEMLIEQEKVGRQYEPGDADSLVSGIKWLVAHPTEREEMGQNARRLIEEKFNTDIIYEHLTRHIEKIKSLD